MNSLPSNIACLGKIRKLFAVSDVQQLNLLTDFDNACDVVVSGDFLVVEAAEEQGIMAAPFDAGLIFADLGDIIRKSGEARIRGSDWFFDGDTDLTIFNGVSLGRQFLIPCMQALRIRDHIYAALGGWVKRFSPESIVILGFECAFPRSSRIEQVHVLSNAANALGIAVESLTQTATGASGPRTIGERESVARYAYSKLIGFLGRVFQFLNGKAHEKKPKVLLLCTHLNVLPLLERIDDLPFRPVLIGERFPNQRNLMWVVRCMRKGVKTIFLRRQSLSSTDREALEHIRLSLQSYWDSERCIAPKELVQFACETIVYDEAFIQAAELTKMSALLLKDAEVDMVLTDALSNTLYNAVLQHAKNHGTLIAATWHAPMLHDVQSFSIGGDLRSSSLVDIIFNWGAAQDIWLERVGASPDSVLTGTMLAPIKRDDRLKPESGKNVLLLEYAYPVTDVTHRPSLSKKYFKDFCAMLGDAGYNVRFKMHPSNDDTSNYKALASKHSLNCEIKNTGLFSSHLEWADIVIGPGHSGAMLETMMAGLPYYPVLFQPHGIWSGYFADLKIFHDVESLRRALDEPYIVPSEFLQMWTSSTTISDPVMETARAIDNALKSPLKRHAIVPSLTKKHA